MRRVFGDIEADVSPALSLYQCHSRQRRRPDSLLVGEGWTDFLVPGSKVACPRSMVGLWTEP
jgi:hypothetical protein